MKKSATIKEKFKTINWNEASKIGLIDDINTKVLHPIGMSITRNIIGGASPCILQDGNSAWTHGNEYETKASVRDGVATFFDDGEPKLNEQQINFLIELNAKNRSGSAPSEDTINLAYVYFLDRENWDGITKKAGFTPQKKALGKTLVRRIIVWHNLLVDWPKDSKEKLETLNNIGKKKISDNVINATVKHIKTGNSANKCATEYGCFMGSVKSALAKIEKFDKAVEEYAKL